MAKKKKKETKRKSTGRAPTRFKPMPAALAEALSEVDRLNQRRRWGEAAEKLRELEQRYPNRPEILGELMNICYETKDYHHFLTYAMRLAKLAPHDSDIKFSLAGAYMVNGYPALALQMYRELARRYPDHEYIDRAKEAIGQLEPIMADILPQFGVSGDDGLALAAEHDLVRASLEHGDYSVARQTAQRLLKIRPDFIPVLNNLSQLEFLEGHINQAIARAEQVLNLQPDNYQALGNITRYHYLAGRPEEARQYAERLYKVQTEDAEARLKKAETFSYLGDDQRVLEVLQESEKAGNPELSFMQAMLYHLAAVAAMRQGDEKQAKRYWQQALRENPQFDLAQENLNDLKLPPGERHAPWPFSFGQWLSRQTIQDLGRYWTPALQRGGDKALSRATQRFLQQHPELKHLVPVLLERGDPQGRELALKLAMVAEDPDLLAALKDFALSQHGPFEARHRALQAVREADLLPPGPVKMWTRGEWQEIMPLAFEIYEEPIEKDFPEQIQEWMSQAYAALNERRGEEAEQLLKQALEQAPDEPSILNNLKAAYLLQKRNKEAAEITEYLYKNHPDYFFGIIGMASLYLEQKKVDEAEALLKPLLFQQRLHISEFSALCMVQIQLALAKDMPEGAERWLQMWEEVTPEHPQLEAWQRQLSAYRLKKLGSKRFSLAGIT